MTKYLALGTTAALTLALQATPVLAQAEEAIRPAGEAGEVAHEQPFLLDFNLGQAFWNLLVFLVLLVVLAKFVWPPILKALQDRERKQEEDLRSAENAAVEARQTLEKYKQQLAEAQQESQRIIEESRAEAKKLGDRLKQQTQDDIDNMRDRAQKDIESAKQRAVDEVYEQTATLATQVAGQILRREVKPEDQRQLIDASLQEFKARQN